MLELNGDGVKTKPDVAGLTGNVRRLRSLALPTGAHSEQLPIGSSQYRISSTLLGQLEEKVEVSH